LLVAVLVLVLSCASSPVPDLDQPPCGGAVDCSTSLGAFQVWEPEGWSGEALDVLVYFHGYEGEPAQYSGSESRMEDFSDAGVLLVLPYGEGGSWDPSGAWGGGGDRRDDMDFYREMVEHVQAWWPTARLWVSGFSLGASMAYQAACEEDLDAAVGTSGGFWEPLPTRCDAGKVPFRHEHGTADSTWPLEGRTFSGGATQGAAVDMVAFWREHNGCAETEVAYDDEPLACLRWSCDQETVVDYCLHDEGHKRPSGWIGRLTTWLASR